MFSELLKCFRLFLDIRHGKTVVVVSKDEKTAKAEVERLKRSWKRFDNLMVQAFEDPTMHIHDWQLSERHVYFDIYDCTLPGCRTLQRRERAVDVEDQDDLGGHDMTEDS